MKILTGLNVRRVAKFLINKMSDRVINISLPLLFTFVVVFIILCYQYSHQIIQELGNILLPEDDFSSTPLTQFVCYKTFPTAIEFENSFPELRDNLLKQVSPLTKQRFEKIIGHSLPPNVYECTIFSIKSDEIRELKFPFGGFMQYYLPLQINDKCYLEISDKIYSWVEGESLLLNLNTNYTYKIINCSEKEVFLLSIVLVKNYSSPVTNWVNQGLLKLF